MLNTIQAALVMFFDSDFMPGEVMLGAMILEGLVDNGLLTDLAKQRLLTCYGVTSSSSSWGVPK